MAPERTLTLVFAGSPEFAVPTMEALQASEHTLVGVYCQPDRPAGRGLQIRQCAVKQSALRLGIPVYQPKSLRSPEAQATLASLRPDVMVVVAYGLVLPIPVLEIPRYGCINVHASLLPRWRGAAPIQRAVLAGDAESGISIMQLDAGLDTGPVYRSVSTPIETAMTAGELHDRLSILGAETLSENLDAIVDGHIRACPQPEEGAVYANKITRDEAKICWEDAAVQVERKVRAFNPWPGAESVSGSRKLKIWRARALEHDSGNPPGTIVAESREGIVVACGQGCLRIERLQSAGRRAMDAAAFINASRLKGTRLG